MEQRAAESAENDLQASPSSAEYGLVLVAPRPCRNYFAAKLRCGHLLAQKTTDVADAIEEGDREEPPRSLAERFAGFAAGIPPGYPIYATYSR